MKYLLKILTLYLILFEVIILYGQNSTVFQKIDQQNGLSNSRITGIIKEKNGFIWIGTQNGLENRVINNPSIIIEHVSSQGIRGKSSLKVKIEFGLLL